MNQPVRKGVGRVKKGGEDGLAFEFKALMPCTDIKMPGRHNVANALSALALGYAVDLSMDAMLETLTEFSGLAHRCEWIAEQSGVSYFNDSKGTNVGATLAALNGLKSETSKIVLIAGGVGKGADFKPLAQAAETVRSIVVIGEDGDKIASVFEGLCKIDRAESMLQAVTMAKQAAQAGDCVLLSPACASFDMFSGFEDRGNAFVNAVAEVSP